MTARGQLWPWLSTWLSDEDRCSRIESLDLQAFVRDSAGFEIDAGERLRLLGVYLDEHGLLSSLPPLAAWEVFSRIYAEAQRLAPSHSAILHSMAVTAVELANGLRDEGEDRRRLLAIAARSAHAAVQLDPDDAENHHLVGWVLYFTDGRGARDALEAFEKALELDPQHAWARLYRAHCLHDLGRFAAAVTAYGEVDPAAFVGHAAWRMELLREQQADCMLRAGDLDGAQAAFAEILRRRERAIANGEDPLVSPVLAEPPVLLARALLGGMFGGPLGSDMLDRLRATLEATGDLWVLEVAAR